MLAFVILASSVASYPGVRYTRKGVIKAAMVVKVLFFAALYERTGVRQTTLEVPERTTVDDLYELLCEQFPQLAEHKSSLVFAVNAEYVSSDHVLDEGDEVALIPPVSGGA